MCYGVKEVEEEGDILQNTTIAQWSIADSVPLVSTKRYPFNECLPSYSNANTE